MFPFFENMRWIRHPKIPPHFSAIAKEFKNIDTYTMFGLTTKDYQTSNGCPVSISTLTESFGLWGPRQSVL